MGGEATDRGCEDEKSADIRFHHCIDAGRIVSGRRSWWEKGFRGR